MVFEEIFAYADKNNDGYLSYSELIQLASPDVNNDNNLDEQEIILGKKSARVWLAYMLHFDQTNEPKILQDNKISLTELINHSKKVPPLLWNVDSNGHPIYNQNGELTPNETGSALLQQADTLLN